MTHKLDTFINIFIFNTITVGKSRKYRHSHFIIFNEYFHNILQCPIYLLHQYECCIELYCSSFSMTLYIVGNYLVISYY